MFIYFLVADIESSCLLLQIFFSRDSFNDFVISISIEVKLLII